MKTYVQYPPRKMQSQDLHGADHALELREVPMGSDFSRQGRHQTANASWKLTENALPG